MLLCSLLALSLIPRPVSARPVEPSTSTTNGPLLLPSSGPDRGLDAGNIGTLIGGATAGAIAVITITLAFVMLRWSRRKTCLYHNKELGEIVPSLPYRKRDVNVETASVGSFEFDLQFPAPALLHAASHNVDTVPVMRETNSGEPPIYSPPISDSDQLSPSDRSSPWPTLTSNILGPP